MARIALAAAAILALVAGSASAKTGEYSTGSINGRIGERLDRSIEVPDAGPVSYVRVSFRITTADTSALAISLVSPAGTEVPLVTNRGRGADFGSAEKSCDGLLTVVDSGMDTNPVSAGSAPFIESPYRPDGALGQLDNQDAKGRWTLRIQNSGPPATLHCFTLDISRNIPQTERAQGGDVSASLTYVERSYFFEHQQLKIVRAGHVALDAPIERVCGQCHEDRPTGLRVRDLDGGEPEVIADMYSGGAHCCLFSVILRYDPATRTYRSRVADWGNFGSKLVDLDHDGLPEFSAFDERFLYTFTAFVFSAAPIQIWSYRQGKLVDVTRRYPAAIAKDASSLWKLYLQGRGQKDADVRSYVAAYVADQYLLGRPDVATRVLDLALKRGDLGPGRSFLGTPAGPAFVALLTKDLKRWGYLRHS